MKPYNMDEIIGGRRYRTETATLIASDVWWDGHNDERNGTNSFLFKTPNGAFFLQFQSQWQGSRDTITPITMGEAKIKYEELPTHEVEYRDAFGEDVEEA